MSQGRVLIVEDDPSIRQLVRTVLEVEGYEVDEVCDGPSAHPKAREVRPDVILLDIGLPGIHGFDVLELLKEDPDVQDIPVMMVTAWAEPELVAKALDRGAHDYVRKPFDVSELARRVEAAARLGAQQDVLRSGDPRLADIPTSDALTGLPNRLQLTDHLEREVATAQRSQRPLSVALLDLDHFAAINADHGHAVGDDVLKAMSRRLSQRVRRSDVIGRWTDGQFLIIAPDTDLGGTGALAEDIRTTLADRPIDGRTTAVRLTGSFGVAQFEAGEDHQKLLARAEAALRAAKEGGRDAVRLADAPAPAPPDASLVT